MKIIPVRSKMIINDIQNYRQIERVSVIDETAQILGCPIEVHRSKEIDPIVAPAEFAGKIANRHHLNNSDTDAREFL